MKTHSCKAKGRKLQQWVRDMVIKVFGLTEDDVRSTSMGARGEDVQLSSKARDLFPFSIECKNVEKLNVYKAYEQAQYNCPEGIEPLLIIKKNRHRPLAVIEAEYFIEKMRRTDHWSEADNPWDITLEDGLEDEN